MDRNGMEWVRDQEIHASTRRDYNIIIIEMGVEIVKNRRGILCRIANCSVLWCLAGYGRLVSM